MTTLYVVLFIVGGIIGLLFLMLAAFFLFPYQFLKFITTILRYTIYRADLIQKTQIPAKGPVLLASNHVSPFDALIIMMLTKRKIHFLMHRRFYDSKYFNWMFRKCGVIPVPPSTHIKKMQELLENVKNMLRNGEIVCVFPEGGVSENGLISNFKNGIFQMIPEDVDVPVIPIRMGMLKGSLFTIYNGRIKYMGKRSLPMPICVYVGEPLPHNISSFDLRQTISEMGAEIEMRPAKGEKVLHYTFLSRAKKHFFQKSYYDYGAKDGTTNFALLLKSLIISKLIRRLPSYNDSDLVGVLLPNCVNHAAVLFGILFADKTPAILNFSSGEETINKVVEFSNIKTILTSRKFISKIKLPENDKMLFLEDVVPQVTKGMKIATLLDVLLLPSYFLMKKYAPKNMHNLDNNLVVLYSSGSTGMPKGVMLTHRNLQSNIYSFGRTINWTDKDVLVGNLPMFHAYGFCVCFTFSAVHGIKVVYLLSPLDNQALCNCVEEHKCTILTATPTFLQNYMRKYKKGQFDSLRLVVTGAEKLRHDISTKFHEMTGLEITEGFGCTELSPIVSINLSQSFFRLGKEYGRKGSIGAALPGIHVKIVDPDTFEPLPPDTPGVMLVKAPSVMKGYLNDPENTAKVLRDGYYITGDIATMSHEGYITITGRLSRFSKIAGEMVPHELVEMSINEVLQSETKVIAVTGKSDPKRGEKLIVFYTTDDLDPEKMVEALREKNLPNLWIPKADDFVKLDAIPLLGSGKVDLQGIKRMAENL